MAIVGDIKYKSSKYVVHRKINVNLKQVIGFLTGDMLVQEDRKSV